MWENIGLIGIIMLVIAAVLLAVLRLLETNVQPESAGESKKDEPTEKGSVTTVQLPNIPDNKSLVVGEWLVLPRPPEHYYYELNLSSMGADLSRQYWKVSNKDVFSSDGRNISKLTLKELLFKSEGIYEIKDLTQKQLYKLELWGLNKPNVDVNRVTELVAHWISGVADAIASLSAQNREALSRQGLKINKRRHSLLSKIYLLKEVETYGPKTRPWTLMCYLKEVELKDREYLNAVGERYDGSIFKINVYQYISESQFNDIFETLRFTEPGPVDNSKGVFNGCQ